MSKDKIVTLSKEDEKVVLDSLREYMSAEFDVDIGNLPAKFLLDYMIDLLGPKIYNQAIDDAEPWLYNRFIGILEDSHALKKD